MKPLWMIPLIPSLLILDWSTTELRAQALVAPAPAPTVAAQLAQPEIKIIPGSALARLVQNNQEFHLMADTNLAASKIDVPDWLKVYYRKQHPKMTSRPKDPTQGYPMALENVYRWMLTHQDLLPARAPEPRAPIATLSAGTNRRISGQQQTPRSESDIRVNFNNPLLILAASNSIDGDGHQAQFYSTDGGVSWGQSSLPLQDNDQFHSDPTVDWSSDGTAWATTMGINGSIMRLKAYKSMDQGQTWAFDAVISGAQSEVDKQMMWVDHSLTSPNRDNIYVIWHNGPVAFVNRRTGPAGSWQSPIQISGAETTGTPIGADITTNNNGHVFGFWPDTGSQSIYMVKSTDGGISFSPPTSLTSTRGSFQVAVPSFANRQALIGVSAAAYSSAQKNLVYAAWMDLSSADDCNSSPSGPGTNPSSKCKTRIYFSRSTSGGNAGSWSAPKIVNPRTSLSDQFNQRLAVDITNGNLVLVYYDSEGDPERKKVNVWYQFSTDDGQSWSSAQMVTTSATNETAGGADSGNQFGDYTGLSGYAGKFYPTWTDRRGGTKEEIWTAQILVGQVNLADAPIPVRQALTRSKNLAADDQMSDVQWSYFAKAEIANQSDGKAVIYKVLGRDPKGHACEMLVDRNLGMVVEFKRTITMAEANENLPQAVQTTLASVVRMDPQFKPAYVEVIYISDKIVAYDFLSGKEPNLRDAVIRTTGELVQKE
jgi:hypothetical protein